MSRFQSIIDAVWPQPDDGLEYVTQTLTGGDYITTGQFEVGTVSSSGVGRSKKNCKKVTSLLFDADVVTLHTAIRESEGEEVEADAGQRKEALYATDESEVAGMKDYLLENVGEHLAAVMGMDPTAIVDTGWGFHFHFALEGFAAEDHEGLSTLHKAIVAEVNRRVALDARKEGMTFEKALDNTNDVGARLARYPGSVNEKCATLHRPVEVVCGDDTARLRPADLSRIAAECQPAPRASSSTPAGKQAAPAGRMEHRKADFSLKFLSSGQSWQEAISGLQPGKRLNTVCPESGSSVGSAFFVVEGDGSSKLISNAANIVWHNTYVAPAAIQAVHGKAVLTMRRDREGKPTSIPQATVSNLQLVLAHDSDWNLWYDDFTQVAMRGDRPLAETDYIDLLLTLETKYQWTMQLPGKDRAWDLMLKVCEDNKRNPVVEYLRSLKWDGEPRLNSWLHNTVVQPGIDAGLAPTNDAALLETYSRKWTLSLVARALRPGCKVDTMLILAGRQGFKKSQIFSVWGDKWYSPSEFDPASKDKYLMLNKLWVYEDAELASGSRAQEESRKNFLSACSDLYRAPYARTAVDRPRHFVIVGTTNDDTFLKDKTGSRRYWTVQVPSDPTLGERDPGQPTSDLDWLRANRDQLLAEAVAAYDGGEEWWLTDAEDAARAGANAAYVERSVWDEAAFALFEANRGGMDNAVSATDFATAVAPDLRTDQIAKMGRTLSVALLAAGFVKGKQVKGRHLYYKPIPAGTTALRGDGLKSITPALPVERETFSRG